MSKKTFPPGFISLPDLAEKLCSEEFSIAEAVQKRDLPTPFIRDETEFFDLSELSELLKIPLVEENFVDADTLIKEIGLSADQIEEACIDEVNPLKSYLLVLGSGSARKTKRLFILSEVAAWMKVHMRIDEAFLNKNRYFEITQDFAGVLIESALGVDVLNPRHERMLKAILFDRCTLDEVRELDKVDFDRASKSTDPDTDLVAFGEKGKIPPGISKQRVSFIFHEGIEKIKELGIQLPTILKEHESMGRLIATQALEIEELNDRLEIFTALEDENYFVKIKDIPEFSSREFNILNSANIRLLGKLVIMEKDELLKIRNIGKDILKTINRVMLKYNYPEK